MLRIGSAATKLASRAAGGNACRRRLGNKGTDTLAKPEELPRLLLRALVDRYAWEVCLPSWQRLASLMRVFRRGHRINADIRLIERPALSRALSPLLVRLCGICAGFPSDRRSAADRTDQAHRSYQLRFARRQHCGTICGSRE